MGTEQDDMHEHSGRFVRTDSCVILECEACGDIELITALSPPGHI